MRRTILMIAGAAAIAGNLKAQTGPDPGERNPATGYWMRPPETTLHWMARSLDSIAQTQTIRLAEEQAQAQAEAQFAINQARHERQAQAQADLYKACQEQAARHERAHPVIAPVPAPPIDDDATIISYLNANGYSQVTLTMINKLRAYMQAHGIRHVAELGQ